MKTTVFQHITTPFLHWLKANPAPWRIGQVAILPAGRDGSAYELRHADDLAADPTKLIPIFDWATWRELIRNDSKGNFRPLKASPNLRHGWRLDALPFEDLVLALQYLYPTALANWQLWREGKLPLISYTDTAARQTGRYHIVGTLTDEQQHALTSEVCSAGCLKRRLWESKAVSVMAGPSEIPLICPEACNYFISKAREKIKGAKEEE